MKTIRDYYLCDAYTARATVLQLNPNGPGGTVILDRTVFVPQGGGQPADHGTIGIAQVTQVESLKTAPDILVHTVAQLAGLVEGSEVELRVDPERRRLHSHLHTGGHLLAALVEEILPGAKACGGHHWPGEGRVEFNFMGVLPASFEQTVVARLTHALQADHPVRKTLSAEGVRYVQIGEYAPLRCGGTHCRHLGEIGCITLRGIKHKQDRLRIGYDIPKSS